MTPKHDLTDVSQADAKERLAELAKLMAAAEIAYHRDDSPEISDGLSRI